MEQVLVCQVTDILSDGAINRFGDRYFNVELDWQLKFSLLDTGSDRLILSFCPLPQIDLAIPASGTGQVWRKRILGMTRAGC